MLTIILLMSKTDQFNEGEKKVLETLRSNLRPGRMLSQWRNLTTTDTTGRASVFGSSLRTRLAALLRSAGTLCNVDGIRRGTHSLRSGGSASMFTAWYEVEVIKRWGRCASSCFQSYIWRDRYATSSIVRGMWSSLPLQSLERGRAGRMGRWGKGKGRDERLVGISHFLSKVLRRKGPQGMQRDGYISLKK